MNSKEQEQYLIQLRRSKLASLLQSGVSQAQASRLLNCSTATISQDAKHLRQESRQYVANYEEHFSDEYMKCVRFLEQIQLFAWTRCQSVKYERNVASLAALAKDACIARAALLCDISLVDRTVGYIEQLKTKHKHLLPLGLVPTSTTDTDTTATSDQDQDQDQQVVTSNGTTVTDEYTDSDPDSEHEQEDEVQST
jgi:hypothetical protein